MLSREEKREMLEDSKNVRRMKSFEQTRLNKEGVISIDEYVSLLDDVQKIFSPFKISSHHTVTKFNKL